MGAETPEVIERDPAVAVRVGPLSCFCLPPAKPAPAQRENGGAAFPAPPPPREQLSEEDTAAAFLGKGCDIVLLLESVHIGRECCVAVRAWLEASNGSCLGETAAWPAKRSNGVPSWHSARPLGRNGNGSNVAGASTLRLELLEHGSVLGSLTLPLTSIPAPGAFTRTFDTSTGGAGSSHAVTLRVLDPASFGGRKTVYLCRHGESTWNQAQSKLDVYELLRTTDHGLSETGRIQAESLAKSLLKVAGTDFSSILQPDAILVSPLVRAVQTAVIAFGDVALTEGPNELLLMANAREKQNFGGLDSSSTKLGDEIVQAARVELEVLYRGQDDSCALDAARRLRFLTREVDDRCVGQIQAASRGENGEWSDAGNATRLYQQADFCLVLPGHLHDMTKRCYDAMAQGCLPVVVTKHRFWMALPFAAQVPWPDFANFRRIRSKDDLRKILRSLLARHEQDQKGIRQRRLALARNVGLFAVHDEAGCTPEERAAFPRYLLGELEARQRVWPHIASSWEFEE
eukprot:TRINITY_DN9656_c0_g1_i4.p1 TRINITY_DN9656_c0_g1~~TRINITY_DN9656_c0_g1_i4.p1  ORF type:complete len:516 (-),score=118.16 TRINITY_DN9656_c0_g1_i4:49-1596(-)